MQAANTHHYSPRTKLETNKLLQVAMGSMDDDYPRKPHHPPRSTFRSKLKLLLLLLSTNLLSIYLFSDIHITNWSPSTTTLNPFSHSTSLLRDLNATQSRLALTLSHVSDLHRRLGTSNSLIESLLSDLARSHRESTSPSILDAWWDSLSGELKLAAGPHPLPFGFTANLGSSHLFPSMGSACRRYSDDLNAFMSYPVGGECPSDDIAAQRLMLKGCEPLPRRRCHPKSPAGYAGPTPFPASLWATPADTSIVWDPYTCKNYSCLVNRDKHPGHYDCKDCFNLAGRERARWMQDSGPLDYSIDGVIRTRPEGTVRIGLDIGGGSGTFAARMRERNVTIVTTSMNFDGPFNSFIAARGLIPLHISVAHRLPFFDGTLDIVHSMHVLSNWIPDVVLEFALFDIYRVLRPGGLFWLDHFFCVGTQLNATYAPMFDRIGFNKLRWHAGRKLDKGVERNEWYVTALLEKPMT